MSLLRNMLQKDPEKRFTIDEILASPWLVDCDCSDNHSEKCESFTRLSLSNEPKVSPVLAKKEKKKKHRFGKFMQMLRL